MSTYKEPRPRRKVASGLRRKVHTRECTECGADTPITLLKNDRCMTCRAPEIEAIAEKASQRASEEKEREKRLAQEKRYREKMYAEKQQAEKERAQLEAERRAEERKAFDQQEEARKELARRELAKQHLLPLVMRVNPDYMPGWVHKDICEHLEWFSNAVAAGQSPRLIINMPPRSGKSELASRIFPAWHLGRNPSHEIIACSYAGSLANDFSRKVRGLLREASYHSVFPDVQLAKDSQSVEVWNTNHGGGYVAAGVGGPITGRGAHVLVIDDPLKNREDAESESTRQSNWDWYTSTAYTRLAPGGGVIVMMTRWHDDDLGGRLLNQMEAGEGDEWKVVRYPAIAEHDELFRKQGEALHPERYPVDALERIKRTIGPRDWSALYQQNPVADDGDYFKKDDFLWFKNQDLSPLEEMNFYTAWDLAIGQKEMNDYTVGITVGVDKKDDIYVVDVQRGRWGTLEIVEKMMKMQKVWQSRMVGIERGHILMTMGPILEKRMRETRTMMPIEELKPGKQDKIARARPIQARMQQRRVYFRSHCDATLALYAEMLRFPNGKHDDQCLVAGTRVSVSGGTVPIERLKAGDSVLTPNGPRTVLAAKCTGEAPIYRLETEDGRVIEGSGNHPMYTKNRGFVRLDALEWYDELITEPLSCLRSRPKLSTESLFGATQTLATDTIGFIGRRIRRTKRLLSTCIAICGNAPTALYPKAITSIILMKTHSTMQSTISNVYHQQNTSCATARRSSDTCKATNISITSMPFVPWRQLGTVLKKGLLGIQKTEKRLGKVGSGMTKFVSLAAVSSEHPSLRGRGFVRQLAGIESGSVQTSVRHVTSDLGHQGLETVNGVVSSISLPNEPNGVSARLNAGTLTPTRVAKVTKTDRVEPVYNLTVAGEHVFFAEGVLTHNCDSMAWIGQLLMYFVVTRDKKQPPKRSWRDKLSKTIRTANKRTAMTS